MIEAIVREYFRCANAEDWEAFAALWIPDAELHGVGGRPRRGREDIVTGYRRFMALWAEHYDEPQRILVCGDTATVEVHFTGLTRAGAPVEFDAVDVIDIRDGRIRRLSNWYDLDVVRPLMRAPQADPGVRIADTVALVTGGASGLGAGVVRMITAHAGRAAILDLPDSAGAALAGELGDASAFFPVDVTQPEQVERAVDGAAAHFGRLSLLVNCAGVSPAARVFDAKRGMYPLSVFRRTVEINLVGLFDVVRHAARQMSANEPGEDGERGLIVNVASIAGLEGQAGQAAYSASKGGVVALTLPLARDLAPWGIRVLTVAPGIMDTPMLAGLDDRRRDALLNLHEFPKRLGRPDDFAGLVRAFVENPLLNGEVVRLDAAARL